MVTFTEITDRSELDSFVKNGWSLDERYLDYTINNRCQLVSGFFCGRVYNCEAIATKEYSLAEKVSRFVLGVLAALATLGIALAFKPLRNLFQNEKQVRFLATFYHESEEGYTANGYSTEEIKFFKVLGRCLSEEGGQHLVEITKFNSQTGEDRQTEQLNDLVIRDILAWLPSECVKLEGIDHAHFTNAGILRV